MTFAGDLKLQNIKAEAERQEREYFNSFFEEMLKLGGENESI